MARPGGAGHARCCWPWIGLLTWVGGLSWFGRLPGDIRITSGNTRIFIPVTSMLLLSLGLSVVLSIVLFLLRRR